MSDVGNAVAAKVALNNHESWLLDLWNLWSIHFYVKTTACEPSSKQLLGTFDDGRSS